MDSAESHSQPTQPQVASVTPAYRRNGKLFSCEPCRRGKLRCDHNSPICGRCAKRQKPEQCIYHPAPLTKPRGSPAGVGPYRSHISTTSPSPAFAVPSYPHSTQAGLTGLASPPSSTGAQQLPQEVERMDPSPASDRKTPSSTFNTPDSRMTFRDSRTGFLGATSFSAVYSENSSILETPRVDSAPRLSDITPEKLKQGVDVLSMLRDIPVYRRLTDREYDLCDGRLVMRLIFRTWIDDLWNELGQILVDGNPEQLFALSELVWHNTRRPMETHGSMTAVEWAKSASGRNLRWEVVGYILSATGLIAINLSNWNSIFESFQELFVDRATFAERMRKASEYCLCFCYESEVLNDIYSAFMFEDLILVECLKGEAHYAAWQRTGEVCDAIVALGLHQGNKPNDETPFFLAEMRKKIFIAAYGHDKAVATFLGRPPRLSYRYCKMEPPLDLSDDQLALQGADLEAALATLDENGWSKSGNFVLNRSTRQRVAFQHYRIREDILELALGSGDDNITEQAENIRMKLDRIHSSLPIFMTVTPELVLSGGDNPYGIAFSTRAGEKAVQQSINAIFVVYIQMDIVNTDFLLQRALINRTRKDTKQLIPISRRMLKLVLQTQSRRDYFRDFQGDMIYMLAMYGLPAAGVLAIELIKQEQTRQHTPNLLPRSETIQDLSVFISALAAISPGEGNFFICDQGRRALSRVLDQILAPSHPPPVAASGEAPQLFDDSSLYFPTGNDADFLQWLEHVEWDKNQWADPANLPVEHTAPPG